MAVPNNTEKQWVISGKKYTLDMQILPCAFTCVPSLSKHSVIFHFFHEYTDVCEDSERYASYCVGLSHCCMPNEFAFLAWGCRVCRGLFDCSAPPLVNSVTSISPSNEVKLAVYSGSSGSTNKPPFIPLFFLSRNSLDSDLVGLVAIFFFRQNYIPYHYIIRLFFIAFCCLSTLGEALSSEQFLKNRVVQASS